MPRQGDGGLPHWRGGPQDQDANRTQRQLIDDVRREAARLGLDWRSVLARTGMSRATRSRLNAGVGGIQTIGRVRRAIAELAEEKGIPLPATSGAASGAVPESEPSQGELRGTIAPATGRRRRWVVVQRKDRQICVGITAESDDEIAARGRVRLERCMPVDDPSGSGATAAALAAVGPTEDATLGPEVPSALVLDVAYVYDATRGAVRAFESLRRAAEA